MFRQKAKCKKAVRIMLAVVITVLILAFFQQLLMPKYMNNIREGALIAEYYDNSGDNDIIFIGDCEVYENFSPITLYETTGITSYISGSGQQLIWQSYYMLEEILRHEIPEVVVFSVLAMQYDEPQNEAYNRLNIDGMRLGLPKLKSARASMMEDESLISYIFPILRYHDRWQSLTAEDFRYLIRREPVSHNGYLMRVDVRPVENVPTGRRLPDYQFGETSYEYLDKMRELCEQHDIELVLIKAPSLYPYWHEAWNQQMISYADEHELMYINFLDHIDEIGLDFSTDTYDAGLHLNLYGAEKLSRYFGPILQDHFQLADRRNEPAVQLAWQEKIAHYEQTKQAQLQDLEQYGYLKNFGGRPDRAE